MAFRLRPKHYAIGALCLSMVVGCATVSEKRNAQQYTTIAADPNRDTKAAAKLHQRALKIIERSANPAFYRCQCVAKTVCNPHRAERLLNDALIADIRYGPAHNTLGTLYYHQRRLYLAAWEFQYAADLMPSKAEPLNNLGMVYEESGQIHRALEYYHMAAELDPVNAEYLGNLARAQFRSGQEIEVTQDTLRRLLVNDTRPEWIGWAEDLLGEHPPRQTGIPATATLNDAGQAEELPPVLPLPSQDAAELILPTPTHSAP